MTYKNNSVIVGLPHRAQAYGGPGSFQTRLIKELKAYGFDIVYPNSKTSPTVILIVGGTIRLDWLLWCKVKGVRIVHRLDGINWRHRVLDCSMQYKIRSEIRNILIKFARNYLADEIIYHDVVASLYQRNNISSLIKRTSENV